MSLKRTQFKRKPPAPYVKAERVAPVYARLTVPVNYARFDAPIVSIPKEAPVVHEGYRKLVRLMACAHCGTFGYTQFCHSDEGKGMGIKSDDRTGWPGCGPHHEGKAMVPGCHFLVGSTGYLTRDQRRSLEAQYASQTRQQIHAAGQWPADLPQFENQPELELIP